MNKAKKSDDKPDKKHKEKPDRRSHEAPERAELSVQSPAELISLLIGGIILSGVLGAVLFLWVRDRNPQPPILEVQSNVEERQGRYYVPFTVVNTGEETAEAVQVIAELKVNDTVVEWGEQQIDFLSSQEEAEGAFIFTRSPTSGELTVRTASYKLP